MNRVKFEPVAQAAGDGPPAAGPTRPLGGPLRGVLLVRHGKTRLNAGGETAGSPDRIRGWLDVPLSPAGELQAVELAASLRSAGLGRVVTSDLARTRASAAASAAAAGGLPVELDPALRPWNLGDFQGQPTAAVLAAIKEYATTRRAAPVPGGESFDAFAARATAAVGRQLDRFRADGVPVAVVTSYRDVQVARAWLANGRTDGALDLNTFLADDAPPGSTFLVQPDGARWLVTRVEGWAETTARWATGLAADALALWARLKNAHWHLTGPRFRDLHLLFDDLAAQAYARVDPLAERARAVASDAPTLLGLGDALNRAALVEAGAPLADADAAVVAVKEGFEAAARRFRTALLFTTSVGDEASTTLFADHLAEVEKSLWFLGELAAEVVAAVPPGKGSGS